METKTKTKLTLLPGLLVVLVATLICLSTIPPPKAHAYDGTVGVGWNGLLQGGNFYYNDVQDNYTIPTFPYYGYPVVNSGDSIENISFFDAYDYLELSFSTPSLKSAYLTRTTIFEYENYDFWCSYEDLANTYFEVEELGVGNIAYITITSTYLGEDNGLHQLDYALSYGQEETNPLMIEYLADLYDTAYAPIKRFGDEELVKFSHLSIKVDWQLYNTTLVDNIQFFIYFDRVNEFSYAEYLSLANTYSNSLIVPTDIDIVGSLATNINSFLQIEILPNFSFMTLLICAVTIPLTLWLLKSYFGG